MTFKRTANQNFEQLLHTSNIGMVVLSANFTDNLLPIDLPINEHHETFQDTVFPRNADSLTVLYLNIRKIGLKINVQISSIKLLSASWLMSDCRSMQYVISGFRHADIMHCKC